MSEHTGGPEMIITLASVKGGTGKTTLSVGLAEVLTSALEEPVLLLDLDPQGSAAGWAAAGGLRSDVRALVGRSAGQVPRLIRDAVDGHRVVVIDTPPGDVGITDAAVGESHFVLIPMKPTTMELSRALSAWKLTEDIPAAVVLSQVQAMTVAPIEIRQLLEEQGAMVCQTEIRQLQAFAQLWGQPLTEGDRAWQAFESLASEIVNRLRGDEQP